MAIKFNHSHFGVFPENPLEDSLFNQDYNGEGNTPPPVENDFLLLEGTNFLLLDGTDFLLL